MIELYEVFKQNNEDLFKTFKSIPKHSLMSQRYGISKHPIWIMGHLTYDYSCTCSRLNIWEELGDDWKTNFREKATVLPIRTVYPSTETILEEFHRYSMILYDEMFLAKSLNKEFVRLLNNQAIHIGQLMSYVLIHCVDD